ncbi:MULTISPECIES: thioredoxin domain-containing protein [Sphingomonas]|uniref:thioredoxin domain-containing protein n=1 Tax=Sphingomonas TaxID=13687 RepID=UPI000DF01D47|nr:MULTISPECIES: thioredoxin domain-containing protein [Sphingomonas]
MKIIALLAAVAVLAGCSGGKGNDSAKADAGPPAPIAAPNGGDWTQTVTKTSEGGMLMGNPNAKVKVVEFSSMTCPHCAHFSENGTPKLVAQYVKTGQVSFELRNFVRDPLDIAMALVTRCAGASAQFFTLTDAMYKDQTAMFERVQAVPQATLQGLASLPPAQQFQRYADYAGLPAFAAQHGLPSAKTSQCLANAAETQQLVAMNSDAVSNYQIEGTPTFLINNRVQQMPGIAEDKVWDTLEQRIKDALA